MPFLEDINGFTINYIQLLDTTGDRTSALFEVIFDGETPKPITISISGTLMSILDISDIGYLTTALKELGERKIKKMIEENNLKDYMFTTSDKQINTVTGFERYKSLRDSI